MLRSLRTRLLILILGSLGLLAGVTTLLSALTLSGLRDRAIATTRAELLQQSQTALNAAVEARLRQFGVITGATQRLAQVGATLVGQAGAGDAELERQLSETLPVLTAAHPAVVRASFLRADRPPYSYPELRATAPISASANPVFALTQPNLDPTSAPVWSGVHAAFAPETPVVSVGVPVRTAGAYRGTLALDIGVRQLGAELTTIGIGQESFTTLTDRDGRLLATSALGQQVLLPDGALVGQFPPLADAAPSLKPVLAALRRGQSGQANLMLRGREYLVSYGRIGQLEWGLTVYVPVDEVTSGASQVGGGITSAATSGFWRTLAIAAAITALTGLLLGFWLRRRLLSPLAALNRGAAQIAAGEPLQLPLPPADELGALMLAVGGMAAQVQAGRVQLEAANGALEQQVTERTAALRRTVDQLEASAGTQQRLLETLRGLTAPIVPVANSALALLLVGQFDAEQISETSLRLLEAADQRRTHTVVIDLTSFVLPDQMVIAAIGRLITAVRLIGVRPILCGVGPETAEGIVALGLNLGEVQTTSSLAEAIEGIRARA